MKTTNIKISTAAKLEHEIHQCYGKSIGWLANVLLVSSSNKVARLKGLAALAERRRVAPMPFSMDLILIDGKAKPWSELEKYTKLYGKPDEVDQDYAAEEKFFEQWSSLIREGKEEEANRLREAFKGKVEE